MTTNARNLLKNLRFDAALKSLIDFALRSLAIIALLPLSIEKRSGAF
jgi:hypothetical protein